MDSSKGTTTPPKNTKKTVYLIRHAESEENRKISALVRSCNSLRKFSLPKSDDVFTSARLLNIPAQVDSSVSDIGTEQISHMGDKLMREKFVQSRKIELVVHSPLLRARQTSLGMLGCLSASTDDDVTKKADTVVRVIQTELLLEKSLAEWTPLYFSGFLDRIKGFEAWLGEQPERTIAVVGHSQFFKAMLGVEFKFDNCEVWKVDFNSAAADDVNNIIRDTGNGASSSSYNDDTSSRWSNLDNIYGCEVKSSPRTVK